MLTCKNCGAPVTFSYKSVFIDEHGDYIDVLIPKAVGLVVSKSIASATELQVYLNIDISRATKLIDIMERVKIVAPSALKNMDCSRKVLVKDKMEALKLLFNAKAKICEKYCEYCGSEIAALPPIQDNTCDSD